MSSTDIALPSAARTAEVIGQATAVEQARAVAEVQAAVVVAQNCPRDMLRATAEVQDSCGRMSLAQRAFYTVPNRGHGPSVHLARELARIWGNISYGVHELRRDDIAGVSEVQAFAWDLQTNTRSTRTFIQPHARMKKVNGKPTRDPLFDLQDIYLSNQNTGARAVRECLFTVLPTWLTEEAQDRCKATLENGDGKPLAERITGMIGAFKTIGVTVEQMETKIGRKRGAWTASDVADMGISYTSITRDGLSKDEEFPAARVSAEDIVGRPERLISDQQMKLLHVLCNERGLQDRDARLDYIRDVIGLDIASSKDLSAQDAGAVIDALQQMEAKP